MVAGETIDASNILPKWNFMGFDKVLEKQFFPIKKVQESDGLQAQ